MSLTTAPARQGVELKDPSVEIPPLPGLELPLLEDVEDDARIFEKESVAWNHLTDLLVKTPEAEIEKHSIGQVSYAQIFHQPREYRGKLVRVSGTAVRVEERRAFAFPLNVSVLYEVWLKMDDAPPREPTLVYALSLPEGFPINQDIHERITFTGFFYKRFPFATETDIASSPLLLAKTISWQQNIPLEKEDTQPPSFWPVLLFALVATGIFLWFYQAGTPKAKALREEPLPEKFTWGEENSDGQTSESLRKEP